jgi:hypothetical protein
MASAALLEWRGDRMLRLDEVEGQCSASVALVPPQPRLVEENLRGYVLLLSAHFQGFCRDLHTECVQIVVSRVRPRLQLLIQDQFRAHRRLDHGNPNLQNIKGDYQRFGFTLDLAAADPANGARLNDLAALNQWRNVAAHHGTIPPGTPPLTLPFLGVWRVSCNGLAASLDGVMYNELRRILRRAPWVP